MSDPKREPNDKEQSQRFVEKARELEVDENRSLFKRAFNKIIPPVAPKRRQHGPTQRQSRNQTTEE